MKKSFLLVVLCLLFIFPLTLTACKNNDNNDDNKDSNVFYDIVFIVDNETYSTIKSKGKEILTFPTDPIKDDYDFDGWYLDNEIWCNEFTSDFFENTTLTENINVYAKFKLHIHTLGDWQITLNPTCTTNGLKTKSCTTCNETLDSEVIPANEHTMSSLLIFKQFPTCISDGLGIRQCCYCDYKINEIIPATGHNFTEWKVDSYSTYYSEGRESRYCLEYKCCSDYLIYNGDHYREYRTIPRLEPTIVTTSELSLEYGKLKWNGESPFGFNVVVNGENYNINSNELEPTLLYDDYNTVKVATIVDYLGTKSEYIELKNFVLNQPISNLQFVDDSENIHFTWDSPSDLYDYIFIYDGVENKIDKSIHSYTISRNLLSVGSNVSIYVQGMPDVNFYSSKKVSITLQQLEKPQLEIEKLNIKWNEVNYAENYKVEALTTTTIKETSYSFDGVSAGEHTIKITALGTNYLSNDSTLTFRKLITPEIKIENNLITWNAIAGQVKYATLFNNVETSFADNSYKIDNYSTQFDMYLYAKPVLENTMQSDRVIISQFNYNQYSTIYWGSICENQILYTNIMKNDVLYIPDNIVSLCDFDSMSINYNIMLIANHVPSNSLKRFITKVIIPVENTIIPSNAFSDCVNLISVELPNGLTTISSNAFTHCESLISIELPDSITTILSDAFSYCFDLTSVYINDLSKWFEIDFIDAGSNPLGYAENLYLDDVLVEDLFIPKNLTIIKQFAFYGCNSLKSVVFEDYSVCHTIENSAFRYCNHLESINICDSIKQIQNNAFYGCENLNSVEIDNLTKWFDIDFENEYSNPHCYTSFNYKIPSDVTEIKPYTVVCGKSSDVFVHKYVVKIQRYAFTVSLDSILNYDNGQTLNIYFEYIYLPQNIESDYWKGDRSWYYLYSYNKPDDSNHNYWYYDENGEIQYW